MAGIIRRYQQLQKEARRTAIEILNVAVAQEELNKLAEKGGANSGAQGGAVTRAENAGGGGGGGQNVGDSAGGSITSGGLKPPVQGALHIPSGRSGFAKPDPDANFLFALDGSGAKIPINYANQVGTRLNIPDPRDSKKAIQAWLVFGVYYAAKSVVTGKFGPSRIGTQAEGSTASTTGSAPSNGAASSGATTSSNASAGKAGAITVNVAPPKQPTPDGIILAKLLERQLATLQQIKDETQRSSGPLSGFRGQRL